MPSSCSSAIWGLSYGSMPSSRKSSTTAIPRIEKRAIFFKRLLPLLEFGREREGVDLSKVVLTHHRLKDQGKRNLPLGEGEGDKLKPLTETGTGEGAGKDKGACWPRSSPR